MEGTRMRKSGLVVLAIAALVVAASEVQAQGFYLGGAYSQAAVNETVIDDNSNAWKLMLGYEFPFPVGIEAQWVDFGELDGVIEAEGGSSNVGYDARTATVALTGRVPLNDFLTLYGKAGWLFWSTDINVSGTASDPHFEDGSDNGNDLFFGAGLRFNFSVVSLFAEYERYKLDTVDLNAVSVGVRLTFN
jgi:OmpA-OmpF porin, OOP family